MNTPSFEDQPAPPNYDQAALLGSLGLQELRDVQAVLSPSADPSSWREAVKAAKAQINDDLAALTRETAQIVLPEHPAYDAEQGPHRYIELVRRENLSRTSFSGGELPAFRYSHPDDFMHYLRLAHGYVAQNAGRIPGYSQSDSKLLKDSFASNMRWLLMPPRIRAEGEHHARRRKVRDEALPGVLFVSEQFLRQSSYSENVTLADVTNARRAVAAQPATMALPDFFQMEESQQYEIVGALGEQWLELRDLLQANAPELLEVKLYGTAHPLAYLGVRVLKQALEELPSQEMAPKVCRAFLSNPQKFKTSLTALAAEQAYIVELAQSSPADPAHSPAAHIQVQSSEQTVVTENMEAITNLLAHPSVRSEVLNLLPGMEVDLLGAGELVPAREADERIDLHLQLLGRALNESHPVKNPRGVVLGRWDGISIGKLLRGRYEGNLRSIRLSRLPLTEEDLERFFGKHYDPAKVQTSSVARLLLTAELKSTGIANPPTAAVGLFLVSRKHTNRSDTIYKSGKKLSANGLALSRSLRSESAAIARVMQGHYLEATFWVGPPGSGKR